jgi:hypothetical protein
MRATMDILDLTTFWGDVQRSKLTLTPEQMSEELVRMFISYLGIETPGMWETQSSESEP